MPSQSHPLHADTAASRTPSDKDAMNGVITSTKHGIMIVAFANDGQPRANVEMVRQYFADHFFADTRDCDRLLVDLEGVSTLDSSSLSPLVHRLREITSAGGRMAVCNVKAQGLRDIFALTRFDQIFTIHPDRETALERMNAERPG